MKAPITSPNNPQLAGTLASKKLLHGEYSRFATFAIHTRFDSVQWLTADAFVIDPITMLPEIIRQEQSFEAAIRGLESTHELAAAA